MRTEPSAARSVIVGIDGSRGAVHAAVWAIAEAVGRDVPLRLVAAAVPTGTAAEDAVRHAATTVESLDTGVKIEWQIARGDPLAVLIEASSSGAMICVGAIGLAHFTRGRTGSTASALAQSAHCPMAIVRGRDGTPPSGAILVILDNLPNDGAVLLAAMEEARLRAAPLHALTTWHPTPDDRGEPGAVATGNRAVRARLDQRLAAWTQRYPDVAVTTVAVHGGLGDYLSSQARAIQLVVVGRRDRHDAAGLFGAAATATLHESNCSVLIINGGHL